MHFIFDIGDHVSFTKEARKVFKDDPDAVALPGTFNQLTGEESTGVLLSAGDIISFESEGGGEDLFYDVQFGKIVIERIPLCYLEIWPPPK